MLDKLIEDIQAAKDHIRIMHNQLEDPQAAKRNEGDTLITGLTIFDKREREGEREN